jgi:hypothetical protein
VLLEPAARLPLWASRQARLIGLPGIPREATTCTCIAAHSRTFLRCHCVLIGQQRSVRILAWMQVDPALRCVRAFVEGCLQPKGRESVTLVILWEAVIERVYRDDAGLRRPVLRRVKVRNQGVPQPVDRSKLVKVFKFPRSYLTVVAVGPEDRREAPKLPTSVGKYCVRIAPGSLLLGDGSCTPATSAGTARDRAASSPLSGTSRPRSS